MNKILVIVDGGVVQQIIPSITSKVMIIDYDNLNAGDEPEDIQTEIYSGNITEGLTGVEFPLAERFKTGNTQLDGTLSRRDNEIYERIKSFEN